VQVGEAAVMVGGHALVATTAWATPQAAWVAAWTAIERALLAQAGVAVAGPAARPPGVGPAALVTRARPHGAAPVRESWSVAGGPHRPAA
jgi:hypothetical protein